MNESYISKLLDTRDAAEELHEAAPSNEDAPGIRAQLNAALTFLNGAVQGARTLEPKLVESVLKARESTVSTNG